ncbi:hypothetical [Yersinia pestis KIM10+]|uniref:Uncharacterized protein n=1 Tax=Yersinia pestis TaxID=632 RepID=Q8CL77_YERPE|nr:hypothetical [Yersinia pestis KIM10+]
MNTHKIIIFQQILEKKKAACAAFYVGNYSLFWSGTLYPAFQFLPRTESHHTARRYRNILTRFRVTPWTLVLVSQIKIAKARQFDLFAILQSTTYFFEE